MNQTRSFLLIAWLAVAFLFFLEWSKGPAAPAPVDVPAATTTPATGDTPSAAALPSAGAIPQAPAATASGAAAPGPTASIAPITITTNVLRLQLDPRGGNLVGADLLAYPVTKEQPEAKVRLLDAATSRFSVAQSGLLAVAGSRAPTHEAVFRTEDGRSDYTLADGAQTLEVPLVWTDAASGVTVRKTLVLERGSYAITQRLEISNQGGQPWSASPYEQLQRIVPPERSTASTFTNPEAFSFVGAAWYSPTEKFEKIAVADLYEDGAQSREVTGGWIAMLQHHFMLAWVPNKAEAQRFEMLPLPDSSRYLVRGVSAPIQVAPGLSTTRESVLWVGPKLQEQLEQIAPGLKLTLDYGIFTFLAQPMFDYVLKPLHDLTGNWGWAIILTVLIIKIALYWLSAKQYRSFAKMRAIQPRIEALKERYGDDKQKFQMAMMELYKKEKVNPAAGCLPILVTIPVFIALYWMLLESVEMRQAPWIGWIQNLTAPDPYFILPAINLVVMYLTQKMTPTPGMDPMQKKIMTFMPLVFGVMMAFFPSGLVLYWCTNGILGLLQQWVITKRHGEKPEATAAAK